MARPSWNDEENMRKKLQATADRRLELLEDIAIWYEADEFEYMPPWLWKRIKKELKELSDATLGG